MRTFALGIGECGRRLGLELFRTTTVNTLQDINKMHDFALMDLTEIEKQLRDVTEMGVPESYANVIRPGEAEHQAGHNLFLGRMEPPPEEGFAEGIIGERGVGGLWFQSKEIAEEIWENFLECFKYHISDKEWCNVLHSGGGGTGCGAGPVFLDKICGHLRREKAVFSENLYTATIVLPHEHWQPWREANSAATIGRHSRMAHGIIIADNLHAQNLVKRAAENNKHIETEDPRELINRRLAEVFVSLHMTNMPENKPITKIYEAADYRRLFSNENYAGVLVPCFHEFGLEDFVKGGLNLNGAVFDTMKNHQLATFELRDFESVIVIITFPAETTGLARNVVKNMGNTEDIAVRLQEMYGRDLEPAVVFTYSQSLTDTVKVTVLVKDPYVPRFPILYQRLKEIVDDPVNMRKALSEMFPRDYNDIEKHEIMENAREEFMRAFYSFSGYLDEQGYDRRRYVERREPARIRD